VGLSCGGHGASEPQTTAFIAAFINTTMTVGKIVSKVCSNKCFSTCFQQGLDLSDAYREGNVRWGSDVFSEAEYTQGVPELAPRSNISRINPIECKGQSQPIIPPGYIAFDAIGSQSANLWEPTTSPAPYFENFL
jgi:hypothetical protein